MIPQTHSKLPHSTLTMDFRSELAMNSNWNEQVLVAQSDSDFHTAFWSAEWQAKHNWYNPGAMILANSYLQATQSHNGNQVEVSALWSLIKWFTNMAQKATIQRVHTSCPQRVILHLLGSLNDSWQYEHIHSSGWSCWWVRSWIAAIAANSGFKSALGP